MSAAADLLRKVQRLVSEKKYRIRIHAVRHMIAEGFSEQNIIEAITGKCKILEDYPEESRCLVYGRFRFDEDEKIDTPLHVVCDYSQAGGIDIITGYIPQKPWWSSPTRRGKKL
ncbi:MAG TPA: DUF4258 domain-containing protein [Blastocatellia bacterium]|nr:DUF4258 domain-containing protein [Blastocatellia bacterium]